MYTLDLYLNTKYFTETFSAAKARGALNLLIKRIFISINIEVVKKKEKKL